MQKRIYKKQFWLNKEELLALKTKSKKVGMNESEYVRNLLLGYEPKEKPDDRFYEVMKLMRAISNNLNQIAKKSHSLGYIDEIFYKKEADKWNKFMNLIKEEFLLK